MIFVSLHLLFRFAIGLLSASFSEWKASYGTYPHGQAQQSVSFEGYVEILLAISLAALSHENSISAIP
jgi:hypothetical protein